MIQKKQQYFFKEAGNLLSEQKRMAEETLRIFVPIAGRLGFDEIAEKLKKLAHKVLREQNSDV